MLLDVPSVGGLENTCCKKESLFQGGRHSFFADSGILFYFTVTYRCFARLNRRPDSFGLFFFYPRFPPHPSFFCFFNDQTFFSMLENSSGSRGALGTDSILVRILVVLILLK